MIDHYGSKDAAKEAAREHRMEQREGQTVKTRCGPEPMKTL